jgi:hypothetical protein
VSTNAVKLGAGPVRAPVAEEAVTIYRTAAQVPGRYEEIALLNATGESTWTNEAKMMNSMRKKAGQMGANAIILDAISEPGAGAKVAAAVFGGGTERKGKAIAIYVLPATPGPHARSAASPRRVSGGMTTPVGPGGPQSCDGVARRAPPRPWTSRGRGASRAGRRYAVPRTRYIE